MIGFFNLCALAIALAFASAAHAESLSAGLLATTLDGENAEPNLLVWYPSTGTEQKFRLGPYDISAARDGAIADGKHPVILFSHGRTGRARNHSATAIRLARAGFIVLAPQHSADRNPSLAKLVESRAEDFHLALARIKSHPQLGDAIDESRLGAAGFSLGALTALTLAGGEPDIKLLQQHCAENKERDPRFCRNRSWWAKVWTLVSVVFRGEKFLDLPPPMPIRTIALVAPVGAVFDAESLKKVNAAVSIHRLADDKTLRHPYHAERLRGLLNVAADDYHTHENAGHYAFIDKFPQRVIDEEGGWVRRVMTDPEGFNRTQFIAEVGGEMAAFFVRNLPSANP